MSSFFIQIFIATLLFRLLIITYTFLGYFQRYDYGSELNMKHYGSAIPPNFTISDITAPIALYYSENDFLVPIEVSTFVYYISLVEF